MECLVDILGKQGGKTPQGILYRLGSVPGEGLAHELLPLPDVGSHPREGAQLGLKESQDYIPPVNRVDFPSLGTLGFSQGKPNSSPDDGSIPSPEVESGLTGTNLPEVGRPGVRLHLQARQGSEGQCQHPAPDSGGELPGDDLTDRRGLSGSDVDQGVGRIPDQLEP